MGLPNHTLQDSALWITNNHSRRLLLAEDHVFPGVDGNAVASIFPDQEDHVIICLSSIGDLNCLKLARYRIRRFSFHGPHFSFHRNQSYRAAENLQSTNHISHLTLIIPYKRRRPLRARFVLFNIVNIPRMANPNSKPDIPQPRCGGYHQVVAQSTQVQKPSFVNS